MSGDLFSAGEPQKPANHSETKPTEKVGYKNPPKSGQFKPGQSGNPKGRKKGARSLKSVVESVAFKKVSVRTANGTKKVPQHQALVEKTMNEALQGDAKARVIMFKLLESAGLNDMLADGVEETAKQMSEEDKVILKALLSTNKEESN